MATLQCRGDFTQLEENLCLPSCSISSPNAFASTCESILARMINTVPSGVALTDEIQAIPAKVSGVGLTIQQNQLLFTATFRVRSFYLVLGFA